MKKSDVKALIGLILMAAGLLGVIICGIMGTVLYFMNPDMTELRLFLTYPWPTIGACISVFVGWIGCFLIRR